MCWATKAFTHHAYENHKSVWHYKLFQNLWNTSLSQMSQELAWNASVLHKIMKATWQFNYLSHWNLMSVMVSQILIFTHTKFNKSFSALLLFVFPDSPGILLHLGSSRALSIIIIPSFLDKGFFSVGVLWYIGCALSVICVYALIAVFACWDPTFCLNCWMLWLLHMWLLSHCDAGYLVLLRLWGLADDWPLVTVVLAAIYVTIICSL